MPQQLCKRRFMRVAAVRESCSEFTLSALHVDPEPKLLRKE